MPGVELESILSPAGKGAGVPVLLPRRAGGCWFPSPHGPQEPGPTPEPSRREGLRPDEDKDLLFGQGGVGEAVGGRDAPAPLSALLQDSASLGSGCNAGGFGRGPRLAKLLFCLAAEGSGGPRVTAPSASGDRRFKGS